MGWFSDDSDQAGAYDQVRSATTLDDARLPHQHSTGYQRPSQGYALAWTDRRRCFVRGIRYYNYFLRSNS